MGAGGLLGGVGWAGGGGGGGGGMWVVVRGGGGGGAQSSSCFKTSCSRLSILALLWSVTKSALHNIFAQGYQQRPEALTILLFN